VNRLGKYQLVAEIARGGMGIVYLAVAQGPARFSKLLVVKELKPELVDDPTFLEMFLEEARLAARLNHPNIVQTYEVGAESSRHYIVMDYLDGVPLARILRKKNPAFDLHMHLRVICESLRGLQYAHALKDFDGSPLGIVHRDVNPQNVFITYDGQTKLVDFGIAKALDSSIETRTGVLKGKPAYMAPEQISGDIDPRADVFAAGVMVWEAAAGRRMWHKKGDVEVLAAVLKGDLPSLRDAAPEAPDALVALCDKSLAKDPNARHQTADELRAELEAYLESSGNNVQMPDVSSAVAGIFHEERAKTRAQIENHINALRARKEDEKLPSLRPPAPEPASMESSLGGMQQATAPGTEVPYEDSVAMREYQQARTKRLIAAFAVLLVGGLTIGGYYMGTRLKRQQQDTGAQTTPTATADPAASTSSVGAVTSPPPAANLPTPPAAPSETVAAKDPGPPRPIAGQVNTAWRPPTRPPQLSHSSSTTTQDKPVTPPPATTATIVEGEKGFLTLDTYPYSRVSTGGRVLGDTPLVRIPLPAGSHVLTLENATEKLRTTITVQIKPGETVSKRLAF
jgi:serine/threonine protein kinase